MKIYPDNWKKAAVRTGTVIILIVLVNAFCLGMYRTYGMSMEPTVRDGAVVFVNKLAYKFHLPQRGDIVVFRTSNRPYVYFMKRVLAFSGETVEFRNGVLFINGAEISEPYLIERGDWNVPPFVVRSGHMFVCGDNRVMAWDDHFHPEITSHTLVGKVKWHR